MKDEKITAREVREKARQKLLDDFKEEARGYEQKFERRCFLYQFLTFLLDQQLRNRNIVVRPDADMPGIPWEQRVALIHFMREAERKIERFQRSHTEKNALIASLLTWATYESVRPYHEALEEQEHENPQLIFGIEPTDRVSLE